MESSANKERRLNDIDWRGHIDRRLNAQDQTLNGIKKTLEAHITTTQELREKMEPVAEAMQTMKSGIKVIGWLGSKVSALIAGLLAVFGAITAWHNWYK
jgi:uncharacterized coiled-coil protein SlyX